MQIAAHYPTGTIVHADPLTKYGGYTILGDKSLLIIADKTELPKIPRKELRSFILLGTELCGDGSSLNLDRGSLSMEVYKLMEPQTFDWCEGAWVDSEANVVIEQSLLLRCPELSNRMRDIIAERLRILFRQSSVISCNAQGECLYIQ